MRAWFLAVFLAGAGVAAAGQVQSRPTDAPIVTAENDPWYARGEPVQFGGDVYYRAGASVFFDGNRMVRTGQFNGVPLYADTTLEPYSIVFVPIGRGLMQPYERRRRGELAGTTGSRLPSFPVAAVPSGSATPVAPSAPTNPPLPQAAVGANAPQPGAVATTGVTLSARPVSDGAVATSGIVSRRPPISAAQLRAVHEAVWVDFLGKRWVSAGAAIPFDGISLVQIGEYAGFPVYTRAGLEDDVIYLPAAGGLVTPYRLKD